MLPAVELLTVNGRAFSANALLVWITHATWSRQCNCHWHPSSNYLNHFSSSSYVLILCSEHFVFFVCCDYIEMDAEIFNCKNLHKFRHFFNFESRFLKFSVKSTQPSNSSDRWCYFSNSSTLHNSNPNPNPKLFDVANRVLCIPATSAASERLYSVAGRMLEKRRISLSAGSLNNLLFLHSSHGRPQAWAREGTCLPLEML